MTTPTEKVQQRPAESAAIVGGIVFVIGRLLGWDDTLTNTIAGIVAALPSVVTFVVERFRQGTNT